jgi:hypothetical protein
VPAVPVRSILRNLALTLGTLVVLGGRAGREREATMGRLGAGAAVLAGVLALAPLSAAAGGFDYTYLDVGSQWVKDERVDAYGTAFMLEGSLGAGEYLYFFGGFADGVIKLPGIQVDASSTEAGGGIHVPVSDRVDAWASVADLRARNETRFGSVTDSGYGLGAGVRAWATAALEVDASYHYVDYGPGPDKSLSAGAVASLVDPVALVVGVTRSDRTWDYTLALRGYF